MKLLNLKKDQTDLCLTENILSDKDTTCSVRLNRNPLKVDCGSMPIYSYVFITIEQPKLIRNIRV